MSTIRWMGLLALFSVLALSVECYYVWPHPSSISQGSGQTYVNPASFQIVFTNVETKLLQAAAERYTKRGLIFPFDTTMTPPSGSVVFTQLNVSVSSSDESLQLGVDESYSLTIDENATQGTLSANTVWGAMRGLETFSQLVDWDDSTQLYSFNCLPTTISDSPRFQWRGLLIDTARHYLDPTAIFRTIDALAYSKFNTLHWHAVDAESFPVISDTYPNLSEGAWFPTATYNHDLIRAVVAFGKERGIRVVPEFDMPGHAYSWGTGYPNITTYCPDYESNINNIPLNPTIDFTFEVLYGFLPEMAGLFEDNYMHVGGDEVITGCWYDNDEVVQWMSDHNMDATDLLQYFENNLLSIMNVANKTGVVWEDLFDDGITLDSNYIVEAWDGADTLQKLINAGYTSISAYGYYLNEQTPLGEDVSSDEWVDTWQIFYTNDPQSGLYGDIDLVIGGEAAMWGEQVDSTNIDSRVWPRACAVSERLWSPSDIINLTDATNRLVEHRCRLARRGIGAGPISPDYCSLPYVPYTSRRP